MLRPRSRITASCTIREERGERGATSPLATVISCGRIIACKRRLPHPHATKEFNAGNFYLNVCAIRAKWGRSLGAWENLDSWIFSWSVRLTGRRVDDMLVSWFTHWSVDACISSGDILIYPSEETNFAALNQMQNVTNSMQQQ